jgi:hypothetical protein
MSRIIENFPLPFIAAIKLISYEILDETVVARLSECGRGAEKQSKQRESQHIRLVSKRGVKKECGWSLSE